MPSDILGPLNDEQRAFVSCWTMRDNESAGLWKAYVPQQAGVAVRSTAGQLESAVAAHSEGGHVARVRYIDYSQVPAMDAFNKRRSSRVSRRSARRSMTSSSTST